MSDDEPTMIPVFAKTVDGNPLDEDRARKLFELINHPRHYTRGTIEVWDFIIDQRLGFLSGNVIKYLCRAGHKGDKITDLKKAKAYLDKLIASEEAAADTPGGDT